MEISLHILDIAENAIAAGASLLEIELIEKKDGYYVTVSDDGVGMDEDELSHSVLERYSTKRYGCGLGLPKLKRAASISGGTFSISSEKGGENHGTTVRASFPKIERGTEQLGDMTGVICSILLGIGDGDLVFTHDITENDISYRVGIDTRAYRRVLGEVPLSTPDVIVSVRHMIEEQYSEAASFFGS